MSLLPAGPSNVVEAHLSPWEVFEPGASWDDVLAAEPHMSTEQVDGGMHGGYAAEPHAPTE